MLSLDIVGFGNVNIEHAVFDYNGTLAKDGNFLPGISDKLFRLHQQVSVHILTADTFGRVRENCVSKPFLLHILKAGDEIEQKSDYVEALGREKVVSFGNGHNDLGMLQKAAIGISVLEAEGIYTKSLIAADLCVSSISEGIDLLLNPLRLAATLRR